MNIPSLKTILATLGVLIVIFAVLDFFNATAWLLFPVTTIRGKISGKPDPTVTAINSSAQV